MHWHGVFFMFPAGGAGFPIPVVRLGWDSHFAGGVGLVPRVSPKSSPKARKVWEWSRALPLGTGPKVRKVWEWSRALPLGTGPVAGGVGISPDVSEVWEYFHGDLR